MNGVQPAREAVSDKIQASSISMEAMHFPPTLSGIVARGRGREHSLTSSNNSG